MQIVSSLIQLRKGNVTHTLDNQVIEVIASL